MRPRSKLISQEQAHRTCPDQKQEHRFTKQFQADGKDAAWCGRRQLVRSFRQEANRSFGFGKTLDLPHIDTLNQGEASRIRPDENRFRSTGRPFTWRTADPRGVRGYTVRSRPLWIFRYGFVPLTVSTGQCACRTTP